MTRALAAAAAAAGTLLLAACGSATASSPRGAAPGGEPANPLATSLDTSADSWAVLPMSANPVFWEVFVRPADSATWRLVTPPGIADNGGLVLAAGGRKSLTVAVRPSQYLTFSALASTADAGANWSAGGPISAGVADSPSALAASGADLAAVLSNGAVQTSSDAGTTWRTIAGPGALAASPAGRKCGTVAVTSVSFGTSGTDVLAGGSCGTSGTTALFAQTPGGWRSLSLPVSGQLLRLSGSTALVRANAGLTELSAGPSGWYAYAPLSAASRPAATGWQASAPLPVTGSVTASGALGASGAWVLLSGRRAATIGGPGQRWLPLPPVPAGTSVLASGPGGATDALAVTGSGQATLTVWQLDRGSTVWTKVQAINVPIQAGSSS